MKILIFGADGFIGSHVAAMLEGRHEVVRVTREQSEASNIIQADLLNKDSVQSVLATVKPEIVISCAGVVENSDAASQNVTFTTNILESITASNLTVRRVIISGSAAEYGQVDAANIPVSEDAPLNAQAGYGLYKLKEEQFALGYAKEHNLPVVVARIFNPIGYGMHPRFLIPKIIAQVEEYKQGTRTELEVSRLDAKRDYINVDDVASAFAVLAENDPQAAVYNIGSGIATTNEQLIELAILNASLPSKPAVRETMPEPEALVAIQADIRRLTNEFGWQPKHSIEETVKEIMHGTNQ